MYKIYTATLIVLIIILFKTIHDKAIDLIKKSIPIEKDLNCNLEHYNIHKKYIDNVLIAKNREFYENDTIKELAYFAVKGGKRVRSVLISSIYEKHMDKDIREIDDDKLNNFICAIEYSHAASLILDDVMDGDITRRGDECMYITHGVAKTQLIAMMLLSQAFKKIHETGIEINKEKNDDNKFASFFAETCKEIFDNYESCSIGQYLDLYGNEDVKMVLHKKTVTLFEIAYLLSFVLITKDYNLKENIQDIKEIAHNFGLFFQISDDFTDIETDRANGSRFNYVLNFGIEKAYDDLFCYKKKWFEKSVEKNLDTVALFDVVQYLWQRSEKIYKSNIED